MQLLFQSYILIRNASRSIVAKSFHYLRVKLFPTEPVRVKAIHSRPSASGTRIFPRHTSICMYRNAYSTRTIHITCTLPTHCIVCTVQHEYCTVVESLYIFNIFSIVLILVKLFHSNIVKLILLIFNKILKLFFILYSIHRNIFTIRLAPLLPLGPPVTAQLKFWLFIISLH